MIEFPRGSDHPRAREVLSSYAWTWGLACRMPRVRRDAATPVGAVADRRRRGCLAIERATSDERPALSTAADRAVPAAVLRRDPDARYRGLVAVDAVPAAIPVEASPKTGTDSGTDRRPSEHN